MVSPESEMKSKIGFFNKTLTNLREAFWRNVYRRHARVALYREAYLDTQRYAQAADLKLEGMRREHVEGAIIRLYHVIEKGLAMPDWRPRFAMPMVRRLIRFLDQWEAMAPCDGPRTDNNQILAAKATLLAYAKKHRERDLDISDLIPPDRLQRYEGIPESYGGTTTLRSLSDDDVTGFRHVVNSRVSVRDFDRARPPARHLIEDAVALAVRTPSVCNRQTWRVHVFEDTMAQTVLALQDGNRGFRHTVPVALVVTTDMRFFVRIIERYQPWIDGGMFAMTLLLALHAKGLGAVPLHWSVENRQDDNFRKIACIPDHERIVMLIACGYPREGALAAKSLRYPVQTFIRWPQKDERHA